MTSQEGPRRTSNRELVFSRVINASTRAVFEAWSMAEIFRKWWVPQSAPIKLESCKMDVRTGGTYRLEFSAGDQTMAFFGKYQEVIPHSRIVWTNDEGGEEAASITTATFKEVGGATEVTVHELYPTKEALDAAIASESAGALPEQLAQLEALLAKP